VKNTTEQSQIHTCEHVVFDSLSGTISFRAASSRDRIT